MQYIYYMEQIIINNKTIVLTNVKLKYFCYFIFIVREKKFKKNMFFFYFFMYIFYYY